MAGVKGDAMDLNSLHILALPGTYVISGIDSPSRVVGKPREDLHVMSFGAERVRQRQALEDRFRLEPLAENEDPQCLNQTRRFT
jgi:hypothetical protein